MKKILSVIILIAVFCSAFYSVKAIPSDTLVDAQLDVIISQDGIWTYIIPSIYKQNEIAVVGYSGNSTEITVPETIDGKTVVSVGDLYMATSNTIGLELIPNHLNVTKITLPKTVKSISDYYIYYYTEDAEDRDPQDPGYALVENYNSILEKETVIIPSLSKPTLNEFSVVDDNPYLSSQDGILYNKDKTELLRYPVGKTKNEFKLPDSVKKVDKLAFANTAITSVDLNKAIDLSPYIFYKSNIEKVSGLENTNQVPRGMFLHSQLKEFPDIQNTNEIKPFAFAYCKNLTTVNIPFKVDIVGSYAFYSCENLEQADFGKIYTLGNSSFARCLKLKQANLPKSCEQVYEYAFSNCQNLKTLTINADFIGDYAFNNCYSLKHINRDIGKNYLNCNEICYKAFTKCTSLEEIILRSEKIGKKAFLDCTALNDIKFSIFPKTVYSNSFTNTAYVNNHKDGIVYIGKTGYTTKLALCYKKPKKSTPSIKLNNKTEIIAIDCLSNLAKIKSIYIPSGTKEILSLNFASNKNLKRVYINSTQAVFNGKIKALKGTKFYIKSNAYTVLKAIKDSKCTYTTNWKPGKIKSVKAVGKTKSSIKITWKKQSYVTGYKVYMKVSKNGKWKKVATLKGSNSTKYTKKGLSKNKSYYFKVRAYKTVENKTYHGAYSSTDISETK